MRTARLQIYVEYKHATGSGNSQLFSLFWLGASVTKEILPASRLYPAQHVLGSPFTLNLDDTWTSLGTKTGQVIGGMQVTVIGHGFDPYGASLYRCVFSEPPGQSQGPTGSRTVQNSHHADNHTVESTPVVPISTNRLVCVIPDWGGASRSIAPALTIKRETTLDARNLAVPRAVCSGGDRSGASCTEVCTVSGCSGCVGGTCVRNDNALVSVEASVRTVTRGAQHFTYQVRLYSRCHHPPLKSGCHSEVWWSFAILATAGCRAVCSASEATASRECPHPHHHRRRIRCIQHLQVRIFWR
jgi:hypothetical protein